MCILFFGSTCAHRQRPADARGNRLASSTPSPQSIPLRAWASFWWHFSYGTLVHDEFYPSAHHGSGKKVGTFN